MMDICKPHRTSTRCGERMIRKMLIGVRIIGLAPQRARRRSVWAAGYQPVQLAPLRAQHLAPLRPICELLLGVGRGGAARSVLLPFGAARLAVALLALARLWKRRWLRLRREHARDAESRLDFLQDGEAPAVPGPDDEMSSRSRRNDPAFFQQLDGLHPCFVRLS